MHAAVLWACMSDRKPATAMARANLFFIESVISVPDAKSIISSLWLTSYPNDNYVFGNAFIKLINLISMCTLKYTFMEYLFGNYRMINTVIFMVENKHNNKCA